jgi:1-acyl-sn-glycerol-3-phosphate acyltransferase
VARKELMVIPFFGWYAWKSGMIVVDREGQAKALKKLVADSRDRLRHDRQIVIFPEGHRGEPGVAGDYKPGVAALYRELGMPCVPMALNTGVHWPAHGLIRKPGTIVFEFLEPIPAGLKRAEFMRTLQDRIETASNALLAEGL